MKINIMNDNTMLTVKTESTLENIQRVASQRPEALSIMDADGAPVFSLGVAKTGTGSINRKGAEFAPIASNDGKAKITICLPETEDAADYVAEQYGTALTNIQTIDHQVQTAVNQLTLQKNTIKQMIHIITE